MALLQCLSDLSSRIVINTKFSVIDMHGITHKQKNLKKKTTTKVDMI